MSQRSWSAADSVKIGINEVLKRIGVDARLQFSLDPPLNESGFQHWSNAMKAVSRLPDGIPNYFRRKLWVTLATHHINSLNIDWEITYKTAFNDRLNPDDDKLGLQIIKDLHRTGWSGLAGEKERILLKRVLLGYARFNKTVGYCQGFNVIAALVLQITDYEEQTALKIMIFLIEQVLPSGYFHQTLLGLSVDMAVLKDLLHQRLPKMALHLDALQKNSESEYEPPLTNVFSMQWFLTLFATCLPKTTVFRLWDALMLEGSEILLRTALAIWTKISRRVIRTRTADEFYGLMSSLCQSLLQMGPAEANDLMQVVYTMAPFPYPGVIELRERYTWNIQPFSSTFKHFRQQVTNILNSDGDDNSDSDSSTATCTLAIVPGGGEPFVAMSSVLGKSITMGDCSLPISSKTIQPSRTNRSLHGSISNNSDDSSSQYCASLEDRWTFSKGATRSQRSSISTLAYEQFDEQLHGIRQKLNVSLDAIQCNTDPEKFIRILSGNDPNRETTTTGKITFHNRRHSFDLQQLARWQTLTSWCQLAKKPTRKKRPNSEWACRKREAKANLLAKSKQMVEQMANNPTESSMAFNPFPTRHKTALIERERVLGLW